MKRLAILKPTGCDLRRLPIDAREAFFLSQVDGRLTLEEIAEVAGLELDQATRVAEHLVDLGALVILETRPPPRFDPRAERESVNPDSRAGKKPDPRVEQISSPPSSRGRRSLRPDKRAEKSSVRPEKRSLRPLGKSTSPPQPRSASEQPATDLDEETIAMIVAFDAKVGKRDYYSILDVERGADKKTIKRAYYALVAKIHPDRFFGKKLGSARGHIERIFKALADAHETLTNPALRASYDATLPPLAENAEEKKENKEEKKEESPAQTRSTSKAMRVASSQTMAVMEEKVEPQVKVIMSARPSKAPASPPTPRAETLSPERVRQLRAAATEIKVQQSIDVLVKAAEAALAANDIVGAANNYRLALSHREDEYLRLKYEDIDARARVLRFEKNIAPAGAAERDKRWADAAVFLVRAHEARPDPDVAARAANALRLSAGDLERAAALAQQAVDLDSRNVGHRVVLGEILLAANKLTRAEAVVADALEIAPKDARVKELAAALTQKAKTKSG